MKKGLFIVLWALMPLVWLACDPPDTPAQDVDSLNVLVYFAADNNLKSSAYENIDSLRAGFIPNEEGHLLYYLDSGNEACLVCLSQNKGQTEEKVVKTYGAVNSASPAQLRRVLEDARELFPAQRYGLVLWSHATGWLPTNAYGQNPVLPSMGVRPAAAEPPYEPFLYDIHAPQYPRVKSFGEDLTDTSVEIELPQLRTALTGLPHEFVIFDCCLMGCVEVAYELKDCCEYVVVSPTEILAEGLHYKTLASQLFVPKKPDLEAVCRQYYEHYRAQQGYFQSATIALVKTSALEEVATAFRAWVQDHRAKLDQLADIDPDYVRLELQVYDRLSIHLFYDLGHLVSTLGTAQEAKAFAKVMDKAVVYKATTENFITIPIRHFCGLSVYVPHRRYTRINPAYQDLAWNQAVGLL